MAASFLTPGRIAGIVVAVAAIFAVGFVIGWVSVPSDEDSDSSERYDIKYIAKQRKEDMKKKDDFHEQLLKILNAEEIGKNLW